MNRWTGTGHLTKDPKFLETENGTAFCTLRVAVKRAGKQGHDGYFDVNEHPGDRCRPVDAGERRDLANALLRAAWSATLSETRVLLLDLLIDVDEGALGETA